MSLASIGTGIGFFFFFLVMALSLMIVVVGLPGTWIILAEALVYALITGFDKGIGWLDLIILLVLAGAGELLEFILTARGAQKYGASNRVTIGAILGGIVGALLVNAVFPVIGALIGAFMGVYLGAFLMTYIFEKDVEKARRISMGAFKGRLGSVMAKETVGLAMAAIIVWQIFWT